MLNITRRFEWDAAHRVLGHEGKCRHLHGHRYVGEVTVEAPALDHLGRVIDFSVIKERVGKWIDIYWDHNALFHREDPMVQQPQIYFSQNGRDPFLMPIGENPTAENIACYLFGMCQTLLLHPLRVVRVRIYETPNCWADYAVN